MTQKLVVDIVYKQLIKIVRRKYGEMADIIVILNVLSMRPMFSRTGSHS